MEESSPKYGPALAPPTTKRSRSEVSSGNIIPEALYQTLCFSTADLLTGHQNVLLNVMCSSRFWHGDVQKKQEWTRCMYLAQALADQYQEFHELATSMAKRHLPEDQYEVIKEGMAFGCKKLPRVNQNLMLDYFNFEMPGLFAQDSNRGGRHFSNSGKETEAIPDKVTLRPIPEVTPAKKLPAQDAKPVNAKYLEYRKKKVLARLNSRSNIAEMERSDLKDESGQIQPEKVGGPIPSPVLTRFTPNDPRPHSADKEEEHKEKAIQKLDHRHSDVYIPKKNGAEMSREIPIKSEHASAGLTKGRCLPKIAPSKSRENTMVDLMEIPIRSKFNSMSKFDVLPSIPSPHMFVAGDNQGNTGVPVVQKKMAKLQKLEPLGIKRKYKDDFPTAPEFSLLANELEETKMLLKFPKLKPITPISKINPMNRILKR